MQFDDLNDEVARGSRSYPYVVCSCWPLINSMFYFPLTLHILLSQLFILYFLISRATCADSKYR